MKRTAGQGTEALRARHLSLSLPSLASESHRDILTTLRAEPEAFQKTDTPLQSSATLLKETETFRKWLKAQGKTKATIKETVNYAKRFGQVLDTGDASPLLTLSVRNKHHAMTALANLAKFQGRYDVFLNIRQRYSLKWSKGDSIQHFDRFFNDDLTFDTMLERIRNMADKTPLQIGNIIKFACLVGLRPGEVVESARLINDKDAFHTYYKPERDALEHFRFPSVFLRQTKKAYISFVSPEIIDMAKAVGRYNISYNAIRLSCLKQGMTCDMRFCRKIFASHLRQCNIQAEVVDLLQGRVAQSVLVKHYLVPKPSYKEDVLKAINELRKMIV